MRIVFKLLIWIASLILIFIIANISIWAYKIWSLTDYMSELNQKEWSESISSISLNDPVSIFSIFTVENDNTWSGNITEDLTQDVEKQEENILITWDQNIEINTWEEIDPYDPEFEDEFNSFFGEDSNTNDISKSIENTWEKVDTELESKDHEVAEELIKRFNE